MRGQRGILFGLVVTGCALLAVVATQSSSAERNGPSRGPIELPGPVTRPKVAVVSKEVTVRGGIAAVVLRCGAGTRQNCIGRLTLTADALGRIGSQRFSLRSGTRRSIAVELSPAALRALEDVPHLDVELGIVAAGAKGGLAGLERPLRLRAGG